MTATPEPAATCVVLREPRGLRSGAAPEIFMVRRHPRASFMAGAYVFPGGRLEPSDGLADASWCEGLDLARVHWPDLPPAASVTYHVAAARELFEEAGVLVARDDLGQFVTETDDRRTADLREARSAVHRGQREFRAVVSGAGLHLALDALLPLAHWVTPAVEAKRFDARFFVTVAPEGQLAQHDAAETTTGEWMTAATALDRCRRGEVLLPPPTWSTLADLARFDSMAAVLASTTGRMIFRREPRFVERDGVRMLVLPGDPFYPASDTERVTVVHPETRFVLQADGWRASRP